MFVGSLTFFDDAVNATKKEIKATSGKLHAFRLVNTTGATAYLQVFDKPAADVIVGTTTPKFAIRMNANEAMALAPARPIDPGGTGITVAGTTTPTGSTNAAISVFAAFE